MDRLPKNIIPSHYDLYINSNLNTFNYTGVVRIHINIISETNFIFINANKLKINKIQIRINNELLKGKFSMEKDDIVKIVFNKVLKQRCKAILVLQFMGIITKNMNGYYVSKYELNGKIQNIFSTQFEATSARDVFPCFDEPDMKTTFSISLTLPGDLIALSNMSVKSIRKENKKKTVLFNTTPKMSTYLIAFVIGNFEYLEKGSKPKIRVYTPIGLKDMGKLALNVAYECIKVYEKYFDIEYPIDKLDMVAIPEFPVGAMENWGLITYRMSSILYDPNQSSISTIKIVSATVCHELAHQWFGNLVTMKWWNDLWLNEGFATWAAAMAISKIPMIGWDVLTSFINDDIKIGKEYDSLNTTHPIIVEIKNSEDIKQISGGILYSKSSSLIKMLEDYIGEDVFRYGLVKYLKKYKYENTTSLNLWDSLSKVSGKNIRKLMEDWTTKSGFPLITVDSKDNKLILRQRRFMMDNSEREGMWFLPIKINFNGRIKLIEMNEEKIEIEKESEDYKLNEGGSGFYSVLYHDTINILNYNDKNKINIINDSFQLALASLIDISVPLKYISEMENETNYEVLYSILSGLTEINSIYYDRIINFESLILKYTTHRHIDLHFPGENINEIARNNLLLNYSVDNNDSDIISKLSDIFMSNNDYVHSVFKSALYTAAIKQNEEGAFKRVFDIYKKGKVADEKILALKALGSTSDENYFIKIMNETLQDNVLLQDKITLFSSLIDNYKKRDDVIRFVINHFDELISKFNNSTMLVSNLIELTISVISKKDLLDEVKEFLKTIKIDGIDMAINKALEKAEIKIKFKEKKIMHWISA
ncbi:Aminopeptidase M1 [Astathelohania contejeani]|uniref:Aminopeptidase n=1 Tax=Astathelohania contejeani TaxID=164912 RepID=A0ABQ7I051_9MICR|nr:Aminopeptidase M1 [Thelohania contejeani]